MNGELYEYARANTKYKIGQTVYVIDDSIAIKCNHCDSGLRSLVLDNRNVTVECPFCGGSGLMSLKIVIKFVVKSVNISFGEYNQTLYNCKRLYGQGSGSFREEDLFDTEEEAIADMQERNRKINELNEVNI